MVLLFHKLTRRPELGISWSTPGCFESLIGRLRRLGVVPCRADEAAASQHDPRRALLTFDDGYDGVYEFGLPILRQHGFTALVFIVAGFLGKKSTWDSNLLGRFRHLDWSQILEMQQAGIEFGSHTVTHPDLTFCSSRRLEWELKESKAVLEEKLGPITSLSYPFGRYNNEVKKAAKQAGYKMAFTIHARSGDGQGDPFVLERVPVRLIDPWWLVQSEIEKPGSLLARYGRAQGRLVNFLSRGTTLLKKKEYRNEPV